MAVLGNPSNSTNTLLTKGLNVAAGPLEVQLRLLEARGPAGIETAWMRSVPFRVTQGGTSTDGFLVAANGFADEQYRESVKVTTREHLRRKAERGEVAGGKVFGYRNVRHAGYVAREIVPEEADTICRIFREVAEGRGYASVAKRLNASLSPALGVGGP